MGIARLEKNALITLDGRPCRIHSILEDGTYQIVDKTSGRITVLGALEVRKKFRQRDLSIPAKNPYPLKKTSIEPTEEELGIIRVRREYVRAMEGVPNTKGRVEEVAENVWQKLKRPSERPSFATIYRWRQRFEISGRDARSLLDNHKTKGNRMPRYSSEVVEICRGAIDRRFLVREHGTIQDAVDEAAIRTLEENRMRPVETHLPRPSRRLVRRLIYSIPAIDRHIAQHGHESARHKFRSVQGHHITNAPLERAEIDHTKLDIEVIDERSNLPLGRPTLTLCIDNYTRCVLGVYIGFLEPSFQSVAACLKDCIRPKDDLRELYPQIKNDWPSFGVMRSLVLDNGREFHSNSLEAACFTLNIEMDYCPRGTPWHKPMIERFIGTMGRNLLHKLPGTTFANIEEKGDYDPRQSAVITLSDLQWIVRKWIVDVYHADLHKSLGISPSEMWHRSIRLEDIPLPDDSVDLDLVLASTKERTLTHKGIELFGLFYNDRDLTQEVNLRGPGQKVVVRYDPGDIGAVHVVFDGGKVVKAKCLTSQYATGLSLFQHDAVKRRRANKNLEDSLDGLLEAKADLQKLLAEVLKGQKPIGRRGARYKEDLERSTPGRDLMFAQPLELPRAELNTFSISKTFQKAQPTHENEFDDDDLLEYKPIRRA